MPLPRVSSRDQKLADTLNALIDAVNDAEASGVITLAGGSGVLTGSINGRPRAGFSLPEARDLVQCRIVSQDGGGDPDDPVNITYQIAAVNEGWTKDEVKPKFGRPSRDGAWTIRAAAEGDPCYWLRRRNSSGEVDDTLSGLWILTEIIEYEDC